MYVLSNRRRRRPRAGGAADTSRSGCKANDPIQPLVIRANLGDCVEINFANDASGGDYGVHIDGLAYDIESSGDAVGNNPSSAAGSGEHAHLPLLRPATTRRWRAPTTSARAPATARPVAHGLFGALSVEPRGSTYLHPDDGQADRVGLGGRSSSRRRRKAFREYALLHHEVGNEDEKVSTSEGKDLPDEGPAHRRPTGRARGPSTTAPSRS